MSDKIANSMLVSFIIPAYNASDTIERCLDSIVTQSWGDMSYEIIVIDDASTDNTIQVIEDYCELLRIGNLTLLRQHENHRQGAARNRGVKIANGDYICFVDSDDVVAEGLVSAISMGEEMQTDMVAVHHVRVDECGCETYQAERMDWSECAIFLGKEMQYIHPWWCSAPWGYIYKKSYLLDVNYPFAEDVLYEDADFVMTHLFYAQRMAYSPHLGYVAYCREGSTTHSMTHRNITDFVLLGLRMLKLHERIKGTSPDVPIKYAEDVLDGACWNMYISAKRLIKLDNVKEVCAFYNRLDSIVKRKTIYADSRFHKYYWNLWTTLCMRHKYITILLLMILIPVRKLYIKLRGQ